MLQTYEKYGHQNYILMREMLWETHNFFGASLIPTQNFKTSQAAHQLLEKILKRKCNEAQTANYGLEIRPDTVLHMPGEFPWLLQPELKAIKDGLTYIEEKKVPMIMIKSGVTKAILMPKVSYREWE